MMTSFRRLLPPLTLACLCSCALTSAFVIPSSPKVATPVNKKLPAANRELPPTHRLSTTTTLLAASSKTAASAKTLASLQTRILTALSAFTSLLFREFKELSRFQKGLLAATFIVGYICGKCKPFWKRYTSIMDMPGSMFGSNASPLRGRAITVSDGDTIRFLHAPLWTSPKILRKGEKASEIGLPIRICTIDTPETAKFGKKGQPFGPEAKEHLKGFLENKRVNVKLLQKDQYGRGVGQVYTGRLFFRKYVDNEMLRVGLAEVYQGAGAVYGPKGKDEYLAIQDAAKKKKLGIWSQKNRESAAEYKKRTK